MSVGLGLGLGYKFNAQDLMLYTGLNLSYVTGSLRPADVSKTSSNKSPNYLPHGARATAKSVVISPKLGVMGRASKCLDWNLEASYNFGDIRINREQKDLIESGPRGFKVRAGVIWRH